MPGWCVDAETAVGCEAKFSISAKSTCGILSSIRYVCSIPHLASASYIIIINCCVVLVDGGDLAHTIPARSWS